jgi:hypothetical protein
MIMMISIANGTPMLHLILLIALCGRIHDGTWIPMIPQQFFLQMDRQGTNALASPPFVASKARKNMNQDACVSF